MSDTNVVTFPIQFLKLSEVLKLVSISKSQAYRMIAAGEFPVPVKLGTASVWPAHEINNWMCQRMAAREAA